MTDHPSDEDEAVRRLRQQRIEARLAELRHLPDGRVPDWWEDCPLCDAAGCGDCDGTGRMHPKCCRWIEDGVGEASYAVPAFMRLLDGPHVGPAQWRRAMLDLHGVTLAHLDEWLEADPALEERYGEAVEAVGREAVARYEAEVAEAAARAIAAAEALLRAAGES